MWASDLLLFVLDTQAHHLTRRLYVLPPFLHRFNISPHQQAKCMARGVEMQLSRVFAEVALRQVSLRIKYLLSLFRNLLD